MKNSDQRIHGRLAERKSEQLRVDANSRRIALGDDLTVVNHHHGLGPARHFSCGLLERVIERSHERGVRRLDNRRRGDVRQQWRRRRISQRVEIAPEQVGRS
ncbi:hypothetical protein [Bradyrhizobium sp. ORS 111]|uniref:hypothetical protein n=1 Tax=Bradyrhizobium sp. ORS 111 TaxID=1685958 RepID=UPI00388EF8A8